MYLVTDSSIQKLSNYFLGPSFFSFFLQEKRKYNNILPIIFWVRLNDKTAQEQLAALLAYQFLFEE